MIPGGRKGRHIPLFFTVGWLFAELLLGIAMVFLIASPGAVVPPAPTPTPVPPTIPVPTATPHPYLSTSPVTIIIPNVDVFGLINNDHTAVANFEGLVIAQLNQKTFQGEPLIGQCAGLVIPYGGEPDLAGQSIAIGAAMTTVLTALGGDPNQSGAFFRLAVYHDPLIWVNGGYGTVKLELYIFIGSTSCQS